MFKFKIKIDGEHNFKTRVSNEHSFKAFVRNTHNFVFTAIDALLYRAANFIPNTYKSKAELVKSTIKARTTGSESYLLTENIVFGLKKVFTFVGNIIFMKDREGRTMLSEWEDFNLIDLPENAQELVGNGIGLFVKAEFNGIKVYAADSLNGESLIKTRIENKPLEQALFEVRKK